MKRFILLMILLFVCNLSCAATRVVDMVENATPTADDITYCADGGVLDRRCTLGAMMPLSGWTDGGSDIYLTDGSDKVGIGTTSPQFTVDVAGTINASNDITIGGGSLCRQDGTNCPVAPTSGWTDGGTNIYLSSITDNVAIGTANPSAKLHVVGDSLLEGVTTVGGSGTSITFQNGFKLDGNTSRKLNISQTDGIYDSNIRLDLDTTESVAEFASTSVIPIETVKFTDMDLQVVGTVSATAFVGDGSGLTGISSGEGVNWSSYDDITTLASANEFLVNVSGNSKSINWENFQALIPSGNITINTTTPVTGADTGTTFTLGVDATKLSGTAPSLTAGTVTTNANLSGDVTSSGNTTTIADSVTVTGWELGSSTATTPAEDDNDTSVATTAYVQTEISGLGSSGGWVDGGTNIYASPTTDNVAIGTTTPTQKLTVVGTVSATAFTGDGSALTGIATGGWTDGGTNVYTETTTDNVGIGTTTPTATLLVSNVGTGNSFRVNDAAADTTPFVITSNGNVGIGTLNPGSALHNNGTMWIGNGSTGSTLIMTANNGMTYTYNFAYDGSARTMHNFVTSGHGGTSGVRTTGVKSSTSSYQTDTGSSVVALHGEATSVNTSGTMDNSYGVLGSTVRNGSGGTVTNAWSIYGAGNTATAGTTTRVYAGGFEGRVGIGGNIGIGSTITGSYVTTTPPTGGMIVEGNVGIGSLTPGQKLDVQGTVRATAFSGDGSALTGISGGSIGIGTANTITFWPTTTTIGSLPTATYPSLTELSYVKGATSNIQTQINGISGGWVDGGTNIYASPTTDNVAIGTTTPTQKLTVVGTVSATAFVGDGSGITGLSAGAWTDGGTNIYPATTSDQVAIGTTTPVAGSILTVNGIIAGGGSGDVRFTGSNVGIGTSTAKSTLLYVSTTGGTVDSASTGDVYIQNDLEVDGTVYMASCSGAGCGTAGGGWVDGGTNIYASPTTDNVGIGTTTPTSGFKLDVRGDSYFLGNIGIGTTVTNARLDLSKNTDTELVLKDTPGENFYNSAQWDGKNYRIYHGSTANPVTTAGPTFKISRGESVASATCGSNPVDSECNAALSVVSAGAATSGMQTAAIAATALTAHAQDAVALWAIGSEVSGGSGKGTGAYLEGGRNDSSGTAVGAEIRISNDASADDTYKTTQISDTSGLWITTNSTGGYDSAEGIGFGAIGSSQFVTGIGFKAGSVKTDSIKDDSSSTNAIHIAGTHTNALIALSGNVGIGSTSPGVALDVGTGAVRIGIGTITPGTMLCVKNIANSRATIGYCTGSVTGNKCGTCN